MATSLNGLRLPNFIIGGAPRSATTWLYELAVRHPDISMAQPVVPEPKFFLVDALYERGLEYYASRWFSALPPGKFYGEKSTNYLESGTACARIALCLPQVRLIFVLRDPVERAYSNYLWSVQNGMETESFSDALALEAAREKTLDSSLRFTRPHAYFARGLYAQMLTPWFERFPRENMLVLRTEDVNAEPRVVAGALQRFVGVDERPDLADGLAAVNASRRDGSERDESAARAMLRERYSEPNMELQRLLGSAFSGW